MSFAEVFHSLCDGKKTLLIAQGYDGKIFGAYTDIPWYTNVAVRKHLHGNSFIFFTKIVNE